MDRLELAEDRPASSKVGQDVEDAGLVARVEREVGVIPVARDPQAEELVALDLDPLHGLGVAERPDLGHAHPGAFEPRSFMTLCSIGRPWQSQPGT